MKGISFGTTSTVAIGLSLAAANSAFAQTTTETPASEATPPPASSAADTSGLADIVVTAEKRSTSLQRTPIAVTAFDGKALADAQIKDIRDFSTIVPSFKASENGGYGQITIRGIGIQNFTPLADSAVAVNLNEVYLARPSSFFSGLYDVSAVEVLRGPQGTLYGRNATAGAVNITTNRPGDLLSGFVNITAGNFGEVKAEAAVGGPIVDDVLKVRIAGYSEHRDGYGKNLTTGQDVDDLSAQGVRGTIVLTPAQGLTATLIGEYGRQHSDAAQHYFGSIGTIGLPGSIGTISATERFGQVLSNSYDVRHDTPDRRSLETYTLTGILAYKTGDFNFKSISAYRKQNSTVLVDSDAGDAPIAVYLSGEHAHQFSQELQANYNSGHLNITTGLYYFNETADGRPSIFAANSEAIDPVLNALGFSIPPRDPYLVNFANLGGKITTKSLAGYAQGTYDVADGLSLTAGIRYSHEQKQLLSRYQADVVTPYSPDAPLPTGLLLPEKTFSSWTPKFGIQYQVTPRTLVYATYAQGFKSGGYDPGADPAGGTVDTSFKPEKLKSYEVGLKATMLDNRLRTNLSAFYYDYRDLQVQQTVGIAVITQNAANAEIYGAEAEITFLPVPELQIAFNGSYLHSQYKDYFGADAAQPLIAGVDFSGNRLNNSPTFSGVASAQYTVPIHEGSIVLRGEVEFTSKVFFSPGNYDLVGQSGFAKGNLYATYRRDDGLSISAFVRNVADKLTRTSALIQTIFIGTPVQGSLAPPRTFGVQLSYRY